MNACIFTVIKNEHLYLDEWIKYHLNLGVDHLFIFEDIDSDSHKAITDKYGENVTLGKIIDIIEESKKEETIRCKTHGGVPQNRYISDGLIYIHNNYNYNWCFVLDIDEYITLEKKEDMLVSVLSKFSEYDAIILQWECYGANGLIHMPDYNKKGIIETYTKTCEFVDSPLNITKVCYNINTYNKTHYSTPHQPGKYCKWCKTDFSTNNKKLVYDNIYLRHYITKSWDEYVWKINVRGMFHKGHRKYENFFRMNKDMKNIKKELIQSVNDNKKG